MKKLISILFVFILTACSQFENVDFNKISPQLPKPTNVSESFFKVRSSLDLMHKIKDTANCVAQLQSLKKGIEALKFPELNIDGKEIYRLMMAQDGLVTLRTYQKYAYWVPFYGRRPVYAYTYVGHDEIHVNTLYYERPMPSLMNTVFHELSHVAKYEHGTHDPIPWKVGEVAEKVAHECMAD